MEEEQVAHADARLQPSQFHRGLVEVENQVRNSNFELPSSAEKFKTMFSKRDRQLGQREVWDRLR